MARPETVQQAFERLSAGLDGYQKNSPPPHRGAEKLAPLRALLALLEQPQEAFKVVHVAGTNGKTTTAAMTARLLRAEGCRTALYTSPHLVSPLERFVINGRRVSRGAFNQGARQVLWAAQRLPASLAEGLAYFDLLTALAFWLFRQAGVEWAVLETGLGGLADATNTAPKQVAVITPIGLDHMSQLGNSLEEIALQKAAIVPPGCPVVAAPQKPPVEALFTRLFAAQGSPLTLLPTVDPARRFGRWPQPMALAARLALAAGEAALGPPSGGQPARWRAAVAQEPHRGKLTKLKNRAGWATLVLDGAHNADALEALAAQLEAWAIRDYTLLLGLLPDKQTEAVLPALARLQAGAARLLVCPPATGAGQAWRAGSPQQLAAFCRRAGGPPPQAAAQLDEALRMAQTPAQPRPGGQPQATLVVAGSIWLVGQTWKALGL